MITRLQNFFLKHNKWLFGGLLCVIIVTFVLTIGPQSFFGSNSGPETRNLDYFGYDLSSERDQRAIAFNSEISATLHPELRLRRDQLMDYAYMRVAGLGIANRLAVPNPSKKELEAFVKTIGVFQDPQTGEFSADSYNRIVTMLQSSERFTKEALAKVLREDFRISKVREALGGPAYTQPFELEMDYIANQTTYDIALASQDFKSFEPQVEPAPEALKAFYDENPEAYRVPEKLKTTGLLFVDQNYLDEVASPTTEEINQFFTRNKQRYQSSPDPTNPDAEIPEVTIDDVYSQVLQDWKLEQARNIAGKKAEAFSLHLYQNNIERESEAFQKLATDYKVKIVDIAPYSRGNAPSMATVPAQVLNSMWIYSSGKRYFSDIGQNRNGAVVVIFDAIVPEYLPAFEEIIPQVEKDYIASEKQRLFAERGEEIYNELLAAGSDLNFEDKIKELGFKYEDIEPFQGSSVPPAVNRSQAWSQAQNLSSGEFTRMVISEKEGSIVFMQEKTVPQVDKNSDEYQAFVDQRIQFANQALGWARLREITDTSLAAIMEPTETE